MRKHMEVVSEAEERLAQLQAEKEKVFDLMVMSQ